MANQVEIESMYDWVDYFHELRLGKFADFTCAYFDGDFNKSLNQAQRDKHLWIFEGVNAMSPGKRILDIGCGWGPILEAIKERRGTGVGLTLSSAQKNYCKKAGLDARLLDWKDADLKQLGIFDAVVSVGSFEHFCSEDEYNEGKQEEIYEKFFDFCADALPMGGRLYLQTMLWGKKVLTSEEISSEPILARLRKFYPGSWPPSSKQQILEISGKRFKFIKSSNGRKDYIETLNRWTASTKNLWRFPTIFKSIAGIFRLIPRYLNEKDFRMQIDSVLLHDQQQCFVHEIMSHERMFFERVK